MWETKATSRYFPEPSRKWVSLLDSWLVVECFDGAAWGNDSIREWIVALLSEFEQAQSTAASTLLFVMVSARTACERENPMDMTKATLSSSIWNRRWTKDLSVGGLLTGEAEAEAVGDWKGVSKSGSDWCSKIQFMAASALLFPVLNKARLQPSLGNPISTNSWRSTSLIVSFGSSAVADGPATSSRTIIERF